MERQAQQTAVTLHLEYRLATDNATQVYSDLRTAFPLGSFPKHAARLWRYGMLAEMWGLIATELCGRKVDYLERWRTGL